MKSLPKNIWMYWHQGFDQAPELVKVCVVKWQSLNPNWNIHLLDATTIGQFMDPLPIREDVRSKMRFAHQSDLIRTQLLVKYGGVWADPTIYPLQPLDHWITEVVPAGFFFFQNPGRDRIISNWFIAAYPGNEFLNQVFVQLCEYWNHNNFVNLGRKELNTFEALLNKIINRNLYFPLVWFHPIMTKFFKITPYLIYHYKVYQLLMKDNEMKEMFKLMPSISAKGPHIVKRYGLKSALHDDVKNIVNQKLQPLLKLDWKIAQKGIEPNTNLEYLMER